MDRQEREQIIQHYCHMAAELRDQHRSTEEILQALSQAGAWQYQCFRAMRAIYGLSISEVKQLIDAREVGTTQSVIGRLELGEQPPSLATLAKLTAHTGLEFHLDITGGDVAMSARAGIRGQSNPINVPHLRPCQGNPPGQTCAPTHPEQGLSLVARRAKPAQSCWPQNSWNGQHDLVDHRPGKALDIDALS